MGKKNIDELYKDKLDGFSPLPNEKVWGMITASLDRKKKKRVVALWYRIGGVAAVLLLFVYIGSSLLSDTTKSDSNVIVNETEHNTTQENDETIFDSEAFNTTEEEVTSAKQEEKTPNFTNKNTPNYAVNDDVAVVKKDSEDFLKSKDPIKEVIAQLKDNNAKQNDSDNGLESFSNNELQTQNEVGEIEETIAETSTADSEKKSIFEEVKADEKQITQNEAGNKWAVGPKVAPVYYNALGKGSSISPVFSENSKSGNINMSYGVAVSYKLNKKLSVRSGVHRVNYGYDTNDIVFTSSIEASNQLENINYKESSENVIVQSLNAPEPLADAQASDTRSSELSARSPEQQGVMTQELGYLEVPLELNYHLIDKKVGVTISGGVSSLFLVENQIFLESNGDTTEMGEANNVNDLNISTNLGVGVDYEFLPNMKITLEPMVKYQLNTFNQTEGTINPYTIGVYSGFVIKF